MFRRCVCRFSAQVEWLNGTRVFTHEGQRWTEYPMPTEPSSDEAVYYAVGNKSMFKKDLPFSPEEADPNIEMVSGGFVWKPTNKTWKRVEESIGKYYYYNQRISCRSPLDVPEMAGETKPEASVAEPEPVVEPEAITPEDIKVEERTVTEPELEVVAAEVQKTATETEPEVAAEPEPEVVVAEPEPEVVVAEPEPEEVVAEEEQKEADVVPSEELKAEVVVEEVTPPAVEEPAEVTVTQIDNEEILVRPSRVTPEVIKEVQREPDFGIVDEDMVPVIEEFTLEEVVKSEEKTDLKFDDDNSIELIQPELSEVADEIPDSRSLAVTRALALISESDSTIATLKTTLPPSIYNKIKSEITIPVPKMDSLFLTDSFSHSDLSLSVEELTSEDYAYRQEGLRGVLYKLAAKEYSNRAIDVEKQLLDIRETLSDPEGLTGETEAEKEEQKKRLQSEAELLEVTLKDCDRLKSDYRTKSESAALLSIETAATHKKSLLPRETKRLLALPYNPFHGVYPVLMPSQASKSLTKFTANCLALSEHLMEAHAVREILQSEASLSATVLESHQHLKTVISDSKKGTWDFKETKANITKAKAMAHYSSETHNSYIFWNSMVPGGSPLQSDSLMGIAIDTLWGSYEQFEEEFIIASRSMMGNGYIWLVYEKPLYVKKNISIKRYSEQKVNPEPESETPLLTEGDSASDAIEVATELSVEPVETLTQKIIKRLYTSDNDEIQEHCLKIITTIQSDSPLAHGMQVCLIIIIIIIIFLLLYSFQTTS